MVWSTTQSALYNDLSRYYEDEKRPRKSSGNPDNFKPDPDENCRCELPEKCPQCCDDKCAEEHDKSCGSRPVKCAENFDVNCCCGSEKNSENRGKNCCNGSQKCTENTCEEKNPPCPNCPHIRQNQGDLITRTISEKFSDRDMLLIAGLIFLLMKQGADKKLILALAFVLLS